MQEFKLKHFIAIAVISAVTTAVIFRIAMVRRLAVGGDLTKPPA